MPKGNKDKHQSRALYRKYRSKRLDEIIGQPHVTAVLSRALAQGRVAHAYLLTGPRGVGKTSIARILAHEINGLPYTDETNHLDIIEIDAASNNGVEDVRELRDKAQIAPTSAAKKVYIIDEVHMLSKSAFNALLKTLEEPPEHVVFILATTDVNKLPATIISRTQRFSLRAIAEADAAAHLKTIAKNENITVSDDALRLIVVHGDGSFRDSISLLDQLTSLADDTDGITAELVEQTLGLAPTNLIDSILAAVDSHDQAAIIAALQRAEADGLQASVLATQLMRVVRERLADHLSYIDLLDQLLEIGRSLQPRFKLLTTLLKAAQPKNTKSVALATSPASVSAPLRALEKKAVQKKPKDPALAPISAPSAAPEPRAAKSQPAASAATAAPRTVSATPPGDLDWAAFLKHASKHHVAIHSVLAKCTPDQQGSTLKLYTVNAFYKKKLDDTKYISKIYETLTAIGATGLELETIPTPPPPKDSQAATVAAIMGGGEEVTLPE